MTHTPDTYREFRTWSKTPRLNRDIVITEKIDGTNAAVLIAEGIDVAPGSPCVAVCVDGEYFTVRAQSRNRLIWPGQDNAGFAKWVWDNASALAEALGTGRHFGEWWGGGIQRGYGLEKDDKRFSLFNTHRYLRQNLHALPNVDIVPILYTGPFSEAVVSECVADLRIFGSAAKDGYMAPEGVIVYHTAANSVFKVTLEGDEAPKSMAA